MSHVYFFRPRSKMEMGAVAEEVLFLDRNQCTDLFDFVFDDGDKHAFLYVDMNNGKMYKGFDEINIVG